MSTDRERVRRWLLRLGTFLTPEDAEMSYKAAALLITPEDMGAWRPIATAPKNRKDILVGHPDGSIALAWWSDDLQEFTDTGDYVLSWPTHWQPLPAPPTEEE